MNRDEQRTRAKALPPDVYECGSLRALYPSESSGGTWIGLNEAGLTIALINWYSKPQLSDTPTFSRGEIIPKLLASSSIHEAELLLINLPLTQFNPFRLIMISAKDDSIDEFRSDTRSLERVSFPWETHQWFSSGFDEQEAMLKRAETCTREFSSTMSYSQATLRRLHQSHLPEKGPYSICMHREDACTVSYTEVIVKSQTISIAYLEGAPCKATSWSKSKLPRSGFPC